MAVKFYIYMDYGAGDVLLTPYNLKCKLKLKRGVLNDFIVRKELDGSFEIIEAEFTAAETYFINNGNYEAVIKVYENGIKGVGILQYEGWARVKGFWNFTEKRVTFDSFRTNDQYTGFLPYINNTFQGESLVGFGSFSGLHSQGQHVNANKLFQYTWSGSAFALSATAPLAITNIGRCAAATISGYIIFLDNANSVLRAYSSSGGGWVLQGSLTVSAFKYKEIDISDVSSTQFDVVSSQGFIDRYSFNGTTFSLVSTRNIGDVKFPSLALAGTVTAIVDELTNNLRLVGFEDSYNLGSTSKPSICKLNTAANRIAFIDAKQKTLKAFTQTGGTFAQVGNGLVLTGLFAPIITAYTSDQIILHDTISGVLQYYSFDGTNWTQTGSTTTLSGGYISAISVLSGNIMVAISDTFSFNGSIMTNYQGIINSLLLQNGIWGASAPNYELQTTGNGATMDVNALVIGTMGDIADNYEEGGSINKYKHKLSDALKWYELFQNYWYIDSSNKIKFIIPANFSTVGTLINVSSLPLADEMNQRTYKDEFLIDQEELIFNNSNNSDFDGNVIDYQRNTPIIETKTYPFTTDLEYLTKIYTGQITQKINSGGLILYYRDNTLVGNMTASGTGIKSLSDTKNYLLSQSQIYNDFLKDYRYKNTGTILINGTSSAVQDTVRNIIEYPEISFTEDQVGLTQFPSSIGSIFWDVVIPQSLIMELSIDLQTREYTASSRLHDI